MRYLIFSALLFSTTAFAQHHHHETEDSTDGCGSMEVFDIASGMCAPRAMAGMPMRRFMLHGNAFLNQTVGERPRGRTAFTVPNMIMSDLGSSFGDRHYVNLDVMLTFERWTFPDDGYPELLQIGEENAEHVPYIDSQHPHSSPLMGLTLSDTISFGEGKDHARVWFAPRGQATDGPIAFMHRETGMVNPEAPLGHHIGQDAGHITSTVIGGSVRLNETQLEASTFHGREPEPAKVDLPLGQPNSYALRLTQFFGPRSFAMTSAAFVKSPEPHDPLIDHVWRYSASFTSRLRTGDWSFANTFIWGLINGYSGASALNSFGEEFLFERDASQIWGRVEVLQRTPAQLGIGSSGDGVWVTAATAGYTHRVSESFGVGGAVTKNILPGELRGAYGGDPMAAKIFVRASGMRMWE